LYRLTSATGRENVPGGGYPFPGWDDTTRSTDPNTTEGYTRKYTYDKLGNIEQIRQIGTNAFTRTFQYYTGTNKLERVNVGGDSYNYYYDAAGNQTLENSNRKFDWDAANRLLFFRNQVGSGEPTVEAQYLYDASGNRVKKIVRKQGGDYEIRVYIDGVFEFYTDETETQNTIHIMDDKSRIATVRIGDAMGDTTPAIKYVLENNIGSSMVLLDNTGAEVNEQEYYPFGETSFGSYSKKRYQYVGKERDEESGMYYYGARYYSAWIGRFVSVDPLKEKRAWLAPYNYVQNNPIKNTDPTGALDDGGGGPGGGTQGGGGGQQGGNTQANAPNQTTSQTQVHSVQKGDTISGLAKQYGVSQDSIRSANPQTQSRSQADQINVGEKLNIPGGKTDNMTGGSTFAYLWSTGSTTPKPMAAGTDSFGNISSTTSKEKVSRNNTTIIGSIWVGAGGPIDSSGNTDWNAAPNSAADGPGKPHDFKYENAGLEGVSGVFFNTNEQGISADRQFVKEELNVIRGYFRDEPDPYRNCEPISLGTASRAGAYSIVIGTGAVFKAHLKLAENAYDSTKSVINRTYNNIAK